MHLPEARDGGIDPYAVCPRTDLLFTVAVKVGGFESDHPDQSVEVVITSNTRLLRTRLTSSRSKGAAVVHPCIIFYSGGVWVIRKVLKNIRG